MLILLSETTILFENGSFQRFWWMQDRAPSPRILTVREILTGVFDDCLMTLQYETEWASRSPDHTPCDFFMGLHEISSIRFTSTDNRRFASKNFIGVLRVGLKFY